MGLGKVYTVGQVVNDVLVFLKQESEKDIDREVVKSFANLSVMEVAETLSVAGNDDWGKTSNVSDNSSNELDYTTYVVTNASHSSSGDYGAIITKTAHGFTTANAVGKRIVAWGTAANIVTAEIMRIIDADNFEINREFGVQVIGTLHYAVFSNHTSPTIDLSGLKIMNITKLKSSNLGEIKKLGDEEFDHLSRYDKKADKLYYHKHGETLFLRIPTGAVTGTLTLYYNEPPQRKSSDSDYFDIRDQHIPLVIQRTLEYCREFLGLIQPDKAAEAKTDKKKKDGLDRRTMIANENKAGVDG